MSTLANSRPKRLRTAFVWTSGTILLVVAIVLVAGCRSSSGTARRADKIVTRHAKSGAEAYAEGHVEEAVEEYRKAVRRAWAMDDPYESGTNAYNLAACLTSMSRVDEASDWLVDSRIELCRANASTGNAWLLSAKIAIGKSMFEDAHWQVNRAACSQPPCGEASKCEGLCGPQDPCREKCITKIPCVGSRIEERQSIKNCEDTYQAQIHLTRARMAAEQYDLECAASEFQQACRLVQDICGYELQAELQNVAALIHIAKGEYLQAGWHLDQEAANLRLAGNYREIPNALQLAAAAYQQAGLLELAADRMCRAARVLYGRGETEASWEFVQRATVIAESACLESTKVRLALLANELLQALSDDGKKTPPSREPESDEMLPSEVETVEHPQESAEELVLQAALGGGLSQPQDDVSAR